jgi:hypothetical protein
MTDDDFDQQSPIGNYLATASDLYAYALDLRNQKKIMSDSLQYIIDMGFDYDGYHSAEDLKSLIDLLVDVARDALAGKPLPEGIPLDSGAFDQWLHGKKPKTRYKVKTKEDFDNVPAGSVIQDAVLDGGCYVGVWSSAMGSYTTSVPEEICEVIGEKK